MTSPEIASIVWWRDSTGDSVVPPLCAIAWAAKGSLESGTVHVAKGPSGTPDGAAVAAALESTVRDQLGGSRILAEPVGDRVEEFLPPRRLAAAGVDVRVVDFGVTANLDVVGGVTAELDADGIVSAIVVVRDGLMPSHARRVIAWAEREISATREDPYAYGWYEAGWRQAGGQRWQITAHS